jgi:hypothetical protein
VCETNVLKEKKERKERKEMGDWLACLLMKRASQQSRVIGGIEEQERGGRGVQQRVHSLGDAGLGQLLGDVVIEEEPKRVSILPSP